jgi:hypothetical protein
MLTWAIVFLYRSDKGWVSGLLPLAAIIGDVMIFYHIASAFRGG